MSHFSSHFHVKHADHIAHDHPDHSVAAIMAETHAKLQKHGHHVEDHDVHHHGHGSVKRAHKG